MSEVIAVTESALKNNVMKGYDEKWGGGGQDVRSDVEGRPSLRK